MNNSKLTFKQKASYGVGAIGKDMVYALISGFFLYYFNTVVGISASFIGVLFLFARVFDAINDPFMGIIVEKTNTKYGKFRPWLFLGTLLNALTIVMMFCVPESLTGTPLLIYVSVSYILWGVTYTIMDIPYWSMIPAISSSGKDREQISVIARSCAALGFALISTLTIKFVSILGNGDERLGYKLLALIVSAFFILAISATVFNIKEQKVVVNHTPTIKEMMHSLIHNDQALTIVVVIIIFNSSLYITQTLALYYFTYDIGDKDMFAVFAAIGGGCQILAMLCLPLLRKYFEGVKILVGAVITALIGYAGLFAVSSMNVRNIVILCLPAGLVFIGFGLGTVLTTVFLADTVDYGEWKNGTRHESVIFSLQTFVVKLASAVSGMIAGVGLDIIGLNQNLTTQAPSTLIGLRVLMIILPTIGLVGALFVFNSKYILNEKMLSRIQRLIREHNEVHNDAHNNAHNETYNEEHNENTISDEVIEKTSTTMSNSSYIMED